MNELLAAIAKVEGIYKLSDRQLCIRLKIDSSVFSRVKSGKRLPSADFLSALSSTFPETSLVVMEYLQNRNNGGKRSGGRGAARKGKAPSPPRPLGNNG